MPKATAIAGSNIAFVKYWGNLDPDLRLPLNGSLSMTLDAARTTTTVEFSPALGADELMLNDEPASPAALARASQHLDRIRGLGGVEHRARIASRNTFPADAGIASSASGFAALTVAACAALGLKLPARELSCLARLASGSASRSIFGGFVEWLPGGRHEDSFARQIAPPDHWQLADVIAVVSTKAKETSSSAGHRAAPTSPFLTCRLAALQGTLARTRSAILERDLDALGRELEADALSLHAVAMTASPSALYWQPATVAIMHAVRAWREDRGSREDRGWREDGLPAYFTIDAGPNVHVITAGEHARAVAARLRQVLGVLRTIVCGPGAGARTCDEHLF